MSLPIKLQKNLFEGEGVLSQGFGEHPEWYAPFGMLGHNGIDYAIPTGRELYSCINGRITERALDQYGYGNYIKVENEDCGVLYGHLKEFKVSVGDEIVAGQLLGISDNTGNSTGSHLHFGLFPKPRDRDNGYAGYIDPLSKANVLWVDNLTNDEPTNNQELQEELEKVKTDRDYQETEKNRYKEERNQYKDELAEIKKQNDGLVLNNELLQGEVEKVINELDILDGEYTTLLDECEETEIELDRVRTALENSSPISAYTNLELFNELIKRFIKGGVKNG